MNTLILRNVLLVPVRHFLMLFSIKMKEYNKKFYFNKDITLDGIRISRSYFSEIRDSEVVLQA